MSSAQDLSDSGADLETFTTDFSDEDTFVGLNPDIASGSTPLPEEESEEEKTISFVPGQGATEENDGFVLETDETLATDAIDLDLGSLDPTESDAHAAKSDSDGLDFELELGDEAMDLSLESTVEVHPEHLGAGNASSEDDTLGLDRDLVGTQAESGDETRQDGGFSLESSDEGRDEQTVRLGSSSDDLDLAFETDELEETQTKLELAEAFFSGGDHDGARRLIDEVVVEGDESQKHSARELLDKLA
jgi:pilus assembly protein FimV